MNPVQKINATISEATEILGLTHGKLLKKPQKTAFLFFAKIINNSRAIVILYESSLFDEAYAIHRLSMEHLFNLSALLNDPDFLEQLQTYSDAQILKALEGIIDDERKSEESSLTPSNKARVETAIADYKANPTKGSGYSVFNAARKSIMPNLYNSRYREISLRHAHSTLVSALNNINAGQAKELLENANDFLKIASELVKKELKIN